ncbi:MAG: flagellar brake protein [Gammaproteobacteria bacterium]|nr:flagellar brake protein [Gammaproteobacteria bacterium]
MSGKELALDIGDNLQLQVAADQGTRYYVKVIGYLAGKSLLVTTPMVDGHVLPISEGQSLIVRLMSGNEIVGFSVTVICSVARPYPHLHLSFPRNVQAVTVRKALRVDLNMPATVHPCLADSFAADAAQPSQPVTIQDMSTSGALLIAKSPLVETGQGLLVSMSFDVADEVEEVTLQAIVRNIRTERGEKVGQRYFHHGVELRLIDRAQSVLVHAFVYQRIARGQG